MPTQKSESMISTSLTFYCYHIAVNRDDSPNLLDPICIQSPHECLIESSSYSRNRSSILRSWSFSNKFDVENPHKTLE